MRELTITERDEGQRIDKYLGKYLNEAPKSFLYKMMRKKNITLNGKKCEGSEHLSAGDVIRMFFSEETFERLSVRQDRLPEPDGEMLPACSPEVVYRDRDLLFVNKPAGLLSQKAKADDLSLTEWIVSYALREGLVSWEELKTCRPSVCNRLDRNTSGLVAAGLTLPGLTFLSEALKERTVRKYYLCLVRGQVRKEKRINGWLVKDGQKNTVRIVKNPGELPEALRQAALPIETAYDPLCGNDRVTLLRVHLITGRSHQIRAHLASEGHPIIGDPKYGEKSVNELYAKCCGVRRQLLHAWYMEFPAFKERFSGLSGKRITAPLPDDFRAVLIREGIEIPGE